MDYINGKLTGVVSANELEKEIKELELTKQELLISGVNIKTINNESILGDGDIDVAGGGGYLTDDLTTTVSLGGISAGTTFPAGTLLEDILRELLCPEVTYKMYWGTTYDVPTGIEDSEDFEEVDCPSNLASVGATHFFTTKTPGEIRGKHCIYAYPELYGELKHIYCNDITSIDLISQWTKIVVTYNNMNYNLYYANEPTKDENSKYQYLFVL